MHDDLDVPDEPPTDADRLIDRALAKSATPEELARLENDAVFRALRQQFTPASDASATNAAWSRVTSAIAQREATPIERGRKTAPPRRTMQRWAIAAAILVVVVGGSIVTLPMLERSRAGAEQVIASAPGQSRTVELADGTTVVLDAGSRIRVPETFGSRTRELSLEGTAYFVVKHDASMPFRVHVRDGVVEDIGTRFVIEAYAELRHTIVSVAEGSVSLLGAGARGAPVSLVVGDVGRLDATGAERIAQRVDVDERATWMRGELAFADTPLSEALPRLSRWYDRDVTLADTSLASRRLTARFRADQPADAVFEGVALALGARVSQQGRVVVLSVAR